MKKVLFSIVVVICGAIMAQAQDAQSLTYKPPTAKSDKANLKLNLCLEDAICISPDCQEGSVTFSTCDDYQGAKPFKSGLSEDFKFKVSSTKKFSVFVNTAQNYLTGSSNTIPISVIKWKLNNVYGNIPGAVGLLKHPLFPNPEILKTILTDFAFKHGPAGGNNTFSLNFQADPGYAYSAGNYSADLVITATQE